MREAIERGVKEAARMILNGNAHRHHRNCVHNLTPQEQFELLAHGTRWTYEQWVSIRGAEPVQITPQDWEIEPPEWTNLRQEGSEHD